MSAIAGTMDEAHYMCSRPDYEPISGKTELRDYMMAQVFKNMRSEYITAWTSFQIGVARGDRKGQAFMNAIDSEDFTRLTGTLLDPFHSDNERDLYVAIDYLLFSKE